MPKPERMAEGRHPCVAVVEQDGPLLGLLTGLLRAEVFSSSRTGRSHPLAELVQGQLTDLLLIDIDLDQETAGGTLIGRLVSSPETASIPLLVCTSVPDAPAVRTVLPRRDDIAVLAKPFELDELL